MAAKRQKTSPPGDHSLDDAQRLAVEQLAANQSALLRLPADALLKVVEYLDIAGALAALPATGRATMQSGHTPPHEVKYRISASRSPIRTLVVFDAQRRRWLADGETTAKVVRGMRIWAANVTTLVLHGSLQAAFAMQAVLPNLETIEVQGRLVISGGQETLDRFLRMALAAFPKWTSCIIHRLENQAFWMTQSFSALLEGSAVRPWKRFDITATQSNELERAGFGLNVTLRLANARMESLQVIGPKGFLRPESPWTLKMTQSLLARLSPKVFRHLALPCDIVASEADAIVTLLLDTFPVLSTLRAPGGLLVSEAVWLRAVSQWPGMFATFLGHASTDGLWLVEGKLSNTGIATLVGRPRNFEVLSTHAGSSFFKEWDAKQFDALLRCSTNWETLRLTGEETVALITSDTWKWAATSLPRLASVIAHTNVTASRAVTDDVLDALAAHSPALATVWFYGGIAGDTPPLTKKTVQLALQNVDVFYLHHGVVSCLSAGDWKQLLSVVDRERSPGTDQRGSIRIPRGIAEQITSTAGGAAHRWPLTNICVTWADEPGPNVTLQVDAMAL